MTQEEHDQILYAAEVMVDFIANLADGKEDDELVFINGAIGALAAECNIDWHEELEPLTAGELRRLTRSAKERLAREDGP